MNNRNLYFVSPLVDGFFMGGASILVFIYYRFFYGGYSNLQVSDTAMAVAAASVWLVNYPHFSATSYRFYQSKDHVAQFPLTAFLIPLLILLGTVACFTWPKEFAPAWAKIYLLWSVYHYSGQNYGLTLVYARRANVEVTKAWRFALAGFLYSCFVAQYAALESIGGEIWVFGINLHMLEIPHWFAAIARLSVCIFALLTFFHAVSWMKREGRAIPWIVGLPVLTQLSWTSLGAQTFSFQMLVPLFHGLQYLLVAWAMEMHRSATLSKAVFQWSFLSARTFIWLTINIAGGALLFFVLPRVAGATGQDLSFSIGVFFVSVQIHHFFVDGVIWKLRGEKGNSPLFQHFRSAFAQGGKT